MRVRLAIHSVAPLGQTRKQPRLGRNDLSPLNHQWQAGFRPMSGTEVGMRLDERAAIRKGRAVAGVEIGFCR